MMYVVDIPHQYAPVVWKPEDESHFIHIAEEQCYIQGKELLCVHTGKELEEIYGADYNDFDCEMIKGLEKLIAKFGLDQKFYKRFDDDFYTVDPRDKFEAAVDWINRDLYCCHIFKSEKEALEGLFDQRLWENEKLRRARVLLKKQLEDDEVCLYGS